MVEHNHAYGSGACAHPDCVKASTPKPLPWEVKHGRVAMIECTTGCSCCHWDNHYRGPFNPSQAEEAIKVLRETRIVASQYAPNGVYRIEEHDCEILPDGRIVVGDTVFPGVFRGVHAAAENVRISPKWFSS